MHKVDLDGYDKKATRQELHVLTNTNRLTYDPNRGMMECNRSTGRSVQPWSPDTPEGVETKGPDNLLGLCIMVNSLQNTIYERLEII